MALADACQIAALVPMAGLLQALGFTVSTHTRRCACILHGGSNPSAFAWRDDGRWFCHSCGVGGDKISLVRAVKNCQFREAVEFLAVLAGVEFHGSRMAMSEIKQLQSEQKALRDDAHVWLAVDASSWRETRDTVLQLEAIRRSAGRRLKEIFGGSPERWRGEMEWCWAALAEVSRQMPRAAAAYAIASFGKFQDRASFALDRVATERLIGVALENGYVTDERGYKFEVIP